MPEQTSGSPLETALTAACEFALRHGVEPPIAPADFGIQRCASGVTNATYVDASHAVTAFVGRYGETSIGVAELTWIHLQADPDRPACGPCGECLACQAVPCECRAARDEAGNIRMNSGRGELVALAQHSRAHVQEWRDHAPPGTRHAALYAAALALLDREAAAERLEAPDG